MRQTNSILDLYDHHPIIEQLINGFAQKDSRQHLKGCAGSLLSVIAAKSFRLCGQQKFVIIANDSERARYIASDIENLYEETQTAISERNVLLFPQTSRTPYQTAELDNANILQRAEVVQQLGSGKRLIVVTSSDAIGEKVVSTRVLNRNTLRLDIGALISMDEVMSQLNEFGFERTDFVVDPGQYAVRGSLIDIFSYSDDHPCRVEFGDDDISSLRMFDIVSQLSTQKLSTFTVVGKLDPAQSTYVERVNLLSYLGKDDIVWVENTMQMCEQLDQNLHTAEKIYNIIDRTIERASPETLYSSSNEMLETMLRCHTVEWGSSSYFSKAKVLNVDADPQPSFNKQFDLLTKELQQKVENGYHTLITVSNKQQLQRLDKIFAANNLFHRELVECCEISLHEGFIDHCKKALCFTDHQIFERYHAYNQRNYNQEREAITLKELFELKPGDYITHIDYGVGKFAGLEKIESNGKEQEVIRLVYKGNATLYISIHSLHKISRYVGKEGEEPTLNRLGSNTWQVMKQRTKKQVKDIAKDLIALYAKRKASRGHAFSADSYLQHELEASFIYEDTPDQDKATRDVKADMEASSPMDRLVCGDVGFGKTEIAIRAAFKAVCDSKQVAVLVPSTILAFQHYNTFSERLHEMPVKIEYLNRFRTTKERNLILNELKEGKIDILIGTHAITNSKVQFKDLGLMIVDEEQKFGVSVKEKLRQMKVNVDCLTLTATPIPRTLQFSLMGARDLSIIQTPPPNRQPTQTELLTFSSEKIRDAIMKEMARGGQTFFISNRIENLAAMADTVHTMVPDAKVAVAHGQMDGKKVEDILMNFLEGEIDVLVATSIIENGLDIPNANTMIINNAQQFGLSDLHQMRGRVGRSNKKAYCYLLVPSLTSLTDDARRRLHAIEEFTNVGSGFNIAMRDLDIRGAGNILGAEQSGFISEIGYDMYHKILNEAIEELKEAEFQDLFADEIAQQKQRSKTCVIETDLSILIPDSYVSSGSQRLLLYKELNDLVSDDELRAYADRLKDRFGPLPLSTKELIKTIALRRTAQEFGVEKLVMKQDVMVCHFSENQDNPFYSSPLFARMVQYATDHPSSIHLKEAHNHLSLKIDNVKSIDSALHKLNAVFVMQS